jgi:hypothetical protein
MVQAAFLPRRQRVETLGVSRIKGGWTSCTLSLVVAIACITKPVPERMA